MPNPLRLITLNNAIVIFITLTIGFRLLRFY